MKSLLTNKKNTQGKGFCYVSLKISPERPAFRYIEELRAQNIKISNHILSLLDKQVK